MRPILTSLLLTFLGVSSAAAQSGVLLGIETASTPQGNNDETDAIHAPEYQTLWVARDKNGQLNVLSSIPQLVVPRRDGFWHVGIAQLCDFTPGEDFPNESLRQVVWAAPVGVAATVGQDSPCTPHKPEDYAPLYGRSDSDKGKLSQCGFELLNVQYLSPEIISASLYSSQSESCEARGERYSSTSTVRKFDSDAPVGFAQLLGPVAGKAYRSALPKHASDDMETESDCGEPDHTNDVEWNVHHERGQWRPVVDQTLGNFGCGVRAPINFPLPPSITGDRVPVFDWKVLKMKAEGMKDAFISPTGDLLIAVTDSGLQFYDFSGGTPGKVLLSLPAKPIVMAQWATGSHVADWTGQIGKLAAQHLPDPVIKASSNQK